MQPQRKERGLGVILFTLTMSRLVVNMTRRFTYPYVPDIARILTVPETAVQSVIGLQAGVGIAGPLFGTLPERLGRKRVMTGALAGIAVLACVGSVVPQFAVFFAVLLGFGACKLLFDMSMQAYVGERVPYSRRGFAIGITELSWAGALITAAVLVGFLLQRFGLQAVFAVIALAAAVAALALWLILPTDAGRGDAGSRAVLTLLDALRLLRGKPVGLAAVAYSFLVSSSNEIFFINFGIWLGVRFEASVAQTISAVLFVALAEACGELAVISLADHLGKRRLALAGMGISSVSYFLLPLAASTLLGAQIGLFIMFFTLETAIVSGLALFTEILPEARAVMMSGVAGGASLGRLSGVMVGGLLYSMTGDFVVVGFAAMVTGLLALATAVRFVHESA